MAVEVVSDNVGGAEVNAKAVEAAEPVVVKNSSFREESNFLADLKDGERKALADLRAKLEEAILENKLFNNDDKEEAKKKPEEEAEAKKEEAEVIAEEKKKEEEESKNPEEADEKAEAEVAAESNEKAVVDKDIALWGVPLLPSKGDEATDVLLLKFLRARDFKVNAAFEMLEKTLRWRKEWDVDAMADREEDALGAELKKACYVDGTDREGHPVCYNVLGVFADDSVYRKAFGTEEGKRNFLRWRVQAMEKDVGKLDFQSGGVASLLQITDLKNSPGPAKKELRAAMKHVLDLFQDNYPEMVARNILINVPFWYYAFSTLFYPFLTQRTKSKFVVARSSKVAETLLKYVPAEAIPVKYGGLKRDDDTEFSAEDGEVTELTVKANSTETIEIPAPEAETTLAWDLTVLGWEVNYKEEFVPSDEGSYTIIVKKGKKMGSQEEAVRNSFRANEPGKVVLTVENVTYKKKKVLFRHKVKSSAKKC